MQKLNIIGFQLNTSVEQNLAENIGSIFGPKFRKIILSFQFIGLPVISNISRMVARASFMVIAPFGLIYKTFLAQNFDFSQQYILYTFLLDQNLENNFKKLPF